MPRRGRAASQSHPDPPAGPVRRPAGPGQRAALKGRGLPEVCQQPARRPPLQQKAGRAFHQRHRHRQAGLLLFGRLAGQRGRPARSPAAAQRRQRAGVAAGRGGQADQRPQFHQRFIVRAGGVGGHLLHDPPGKQPPDGRAGDVGVVVKQAGQRPAARCRPPPGPECRRRCWRWPRPCSPRWPGSARSASQLAGRNAAVLFADDAGGFFAYWPPGCSTPAPARACAAGRAGRRPGRRGRAARTTNRS